MNNRKTRGLLRQSRRILSHSFSDTSSEQPIILSDDDNSSDSEHFTNTPKRKDKQQLINKNKRNAVDEMKKDKASKLVGIINNNSNKDRTPRTLVSGRSIRKRSKERLSNSKTSTGSISDFLSEADKLTAQRKGNNESLLKLRKVKTSKNSSNNTNSTSNKHESNPSNLINSEAVNDLKMETIRRKISNRIAQKQWEEISLDSIGEVSKLLYMHVEPVLAGVKSEKSRLKSREIIHQVVMELLDEVNGSLVPTGFKSENFNLDKITIRVQKLQKSYSDNLLQIAELEKTLDRNQKSYESNKLYFEKLEENFKQNVNEFSREYNIRNQQDKEALEFTTSQPLDSSDSVNLLNSRGISNLLNINVEEEAQKFLALSSFISTNQKEELKSLKNYSEKSDEELLSVTQSLTTNLQKLNLNVDVLYKLNEKIDEVYSILK